MHRSLGGLREVDGLIKGFSKFSVALGKPTPQFGVLALNTATHIVPHCHRQAAPLRSQLYPACDDLGRRLPGGASAGGSVQLNWQAGGYRLGMNDGFPNPE